MIDPRKKCLSVVILPVFTLLTIVFLCNVNPVSSVKCWVCNSFADGSCGDPFDNHTFPITDCDAELGVRVNLKFQNGQPIPSTMCRKIVQKVEGKWRYIRSCAYLGEPGIGGDERFCSRRMGTNDIYQEDCLCIGKDGCNGQKKIADTGIIIVTGVAFLALIVSKLKFV